MKNLLPTTLALVLILAAACSPPPPPDEGMKVLQFFEHEELVWISDTGGYYPTGVIVEEVRRQGETRTLFYMPCGNPEQESIEVEEGVEARLLVKRWVFNRYPLTPWWGWFREIWEYEGILPAH